MSRAQIMKQVVDENNVLLKSAAIVIALSKLDTERLDKDMVSHLIRKATENVEALRAMGVIKNK